MPRTKQRTPALRAQILQSARQLLEEEGVAGFKTRTLAQRAGTSLPAIYELFGDKSGLVRALFFEGFRQLGAQLHAIPDTDDPLSDLAHLFHRLHDFLLDQPRLSDVMFSRPFAHFHPSPAEQQVGTAVRERIVERIQACINRGLLKGDATDLAHVLLALAQGLFAQERAGWLGHSEASKRRRWDLAFDSLIAGNAGAG